MALTETQKEKGNMTPIIVNKEDLEAANKAVRELQVEVDDYIKTVHVMMDLNRKLTEHWEEAQVEIGRLRARLSEFEVK